MDTPFLPGLRHSLAALGRSLRSVRSKPIPELQHFFSSLFPDTLFHRESSGPNSRERIFTLQRTFWLFLFQALTPKTSLRKPATPSAPSWNSPARSPAPSQQGPIPGLADGSPSLSSTRHSIIR